MRKISSSSSFLIAAACIFLPLCQTPVYCGQTAKRDLALCVGVGHYQTSPSPSAPPADAQAIGAALESTGLFRKVIVLSDASDNPRLMPTGKNITDMLTLLARSASEDATIVFYFSGRGDMLDSIPRIQPCDADDSDGIELSSIASILNSGKAGSAVLLVDAAWPGSGNGGVTGVVPVDGAAVIVSCQPGQQSVADEESGRGLFLWRWKTCSATPPMRH